MGVFVGYSKNMIRKNLIEWQWSDYFPKHRNKVNLCLHLVAVPLFWLGCLYMLVGLFGRPLWTIILGPFLIAVSVAIQGLGHKL